MAVCSKERSIVLQITVICARRIPVSPFHLVRSWSVKVFSKGTCFVHSKLKRYRFKVERFALLEIVKIKQTGFSAPWNSTDEIPWVPSCIHFSWVFFHEAYGTNIFFVVKSTTSFKVYIKWSLEQWLGTDNWYRTIYIKFHKVLSLFT